MQFQECKSHNIIEEEEGEWQVEVREEQWTAYHKTYQCHLSVISALIQLEFDPQCQLLPLWVHDDS